MREAASSAVIEDHPVPERLGLEEQVLGEVVTVARCGRRLHRPEHPVLIGVGWRPELSLLRLPGPGGGSCGACSG
ncbi:hypothetical protein GCM10018987_16430 [Streptomyces cremeus]